MDRRGVLKAGAALSAAGLAGGTAAAQVPPAPPSTTVDEGGVWRWADGREVALFGVNYDLPSASAFRFAKATGKPFADIISVDFAHFRRLGFDAIRLCFWGDWESTEGDGRLIENEHLRVLDQVVERAALAGVSCLLSPIVTYDALWPDAMEQPRAGIASAFKKETLGKDPAAIAAQARYLGQLMSRTNPRTGRRYADEPAIIAVEPINEPWHHSADQPGSIRYINALASAVRGAGYRGPIFFNLTQDSGMAPAISAADIQGATFAWYPTGLGMQRAVPGNGLLLVDDYGQFDNPALKNRARLIYEFDAADSMATYFYPAMVREFRRGGAQFATMFAYDSLPIAASNSEFNDHFLSLAYTPGKAISALIASTAMRTLPRGRDYGSFPTNMRFDGFRVDDRTNLSEFVDATRFYHSATTQTRPQDVARLDRLAGCGSSPVVSYDGTGAWFLDRLAPGVWRLEVYPDAALTANPFVFRRPARAAVRIVHRSRRLKLSLPDLGDRYQVSRADGTTAGVARDGAIALTPGVYRLSRAATTQKVDPTFHAPAGESFAPIVQHEPPASLTAGKLWTAELEIIAPNPPTSVKLHLRTEGGMVVAPMSPSPGFRYSGTVLPDTIKAGFLDYYITIEGDGPSRVAPGSEGTWPGDWDFPKRGGYRVPVVAADAPLVLFDAGRHGDAVIVPFNPSSTFGTTRIAPSGGGRTALRLDGAAVAKASENDVPAQYAWDGALDVQGRDIARLTAVTIEGRSLTNAPGKILVALIERDGTAWGAIVTLDPSGAAVRLPLSSLRIVQAALLPRDYPLGVNPYWLRTPASRRSTTGGPHVLDLQAIQCALGARFLGNETPVVEIERIALTV